MANYKVIEKIGEGGMGVVYRAQQTALGRDVALKLLLSGDAARPNDLARFAREVRAIARISHPNVIRILDYGTIDGRPYYAMEYLGQASTLGQVLKRDVTLTIARTTSVARQLLDALAAVHRHGLIHRDVKPGNIMVDPEDHVTLMDFGLVKDLEASSMTKTGMMIGTPRYLAPEAVQAEPVDARADLFAVGVMLHEGISGKRLFHGDTLVALAMQIVHQPAPPLRTERRDCPIWLADLVHRLLAKDPDQRPQTAIEALNELRAGLGENPQAPLPAPETLTAATPGDPLPESTILGGLDALREELLSTSSESTAAPGAPTAAVSPPTPAALPKRTGSHPALGARGTGQTPALARPASSNTRVIVSASATFAAAFALTLCVFLPRGRDTTTPTSPPASAVPAPAHPTTAAARALAEAIEMLQPAARIAELRLALRPLSGHWFRNPPNKRMVDLRTGARADLNARARTLQLGARLSAFIPVRGDYFANKAIPAQDRLATYVLLNDLLDLELFCDRFEIGFAPVAGRAFPTNFGQITSGALFHAPAAGLALVDAVEQKPFQPPDDPHAAKWTIAVSQETQRFHGRDDAETSDLMKTIGEGPRVHRDFEPASPLLSLEGVQELELSGWCSSLDTNSTFEIHLSDGSAWRKVAIIRGLAANEPQRWWHTVDRSLFTGPNLRMRVTYRYLPDMNSGKEFAYLYQIQVHHKP